jgi:hypothetical protein
MPRIVGLGMSRWQQADLQLVAHNHMLGGHAMAAGDKEFVEIVVQATTVARGGTAKPIFNVFHYRRTNIVLPVTKAHIETAFQADVGALMLLFLSVDYVQTQTTIRFFDDALDAPIAFAETGVGAIAGQRMDSFVAAVVRLQSTTKGRFARGSKHFGPIAESSSNGDTLEAADFGRLQAIGAGIVDGFSDADANFWQPVIKSGKAPAQYKTNPCMVRTYDAIAYVANKTPGTMKRRKVRTVV